MMFSGICYLCNKNVTFDRFNSPVFGGWSKRKVFCNDKGVRQSEFYQAQAVGLKPEIMIEVHKEEYQGEEYIEIRQEMYKILRTYPAKGDRTEIVATAMVNDGND